ncbi:MAG: Kelch repeat-containing protein [Polyangiaceae bacterium]
MNARSLCFVGLFLVSCSSASSAPPPAPSWTDAPSTLSVRQGTEVLVPLTIHASNASAVNVAASAPDGMTVQTTSAGIEVRAGFEIDGMQTISVTLSDANGTTEVDVPVQVTPLDWKTKLSWTQAGPEPREHGTFFFDATARVAWLFQGSGYEPNVTQGTPIEDDWKLDLTSGAWSQWTGTGDVPPPAGSRRAVQADAKSYYMFGGYSGASGETDDGDTYRVDLSGAVPAFTRLTATGAIPARSLHVMGWDAPHNRLVVFGGIVDATYDVLNDTWLGAVSGDTVTWTQLPKTGAVPTGRYGSFGGLDAKNDRLIVFSGAQEPKNQSDLVRAAQDTWVLDLTAEPPMWTQLSPAGTSPPGRRNGCGVMDPTNGRLLVFGGTSDGATTQPGLFSLDLTAGAEEWDAIARDDAPHIRSSGFGFADAKTGDVYCGFGNDDVAYPDLSSLGYAAQTP